MYVSSPTYISEIIHMLISKHVLKCFAAQPPNRGANIRAEGEHSEEETHKAVQGKWEGSFKFIIV